VDEGVQGRPRGSNRSIQGCRAHRGEPEPHLTDVGAGQEWPGKSSSGVAIGGLESMRGGESERGVVSERGLGQGWGGV
jgi:hypothetical protein